MTSVQEEQHLQQLKQFVYDEDKIVTLLWTCKTLNLDINDASALLHRFVKDETSGLGVYYMLSGIVEQNGKLRSRIIIAKDSELDIKKKMFKEVTSQSIYSVQKGKVVALSTIGLVDNFEWNGEKGPLLGCHVSPNCTKRENLRTSRVLPSIQRVASTDKSKATHLFAKTSSNQNLNTNRDDKVVDPIVPAKKEVNDVAKKQATKQIESRKLVKQSSNEKSSIANMFANAPPSKQTKDQKENDKAVEMNGNDGKSMQAKSKIDLYDSGTDEEAKKIENENRTKRKTTGRAKKQGGSTKKRQRKDHSTDRPEKKRKRIVEFAESDDDMFASDENTSQVEIVESEDEIPVKEAVKMMSPRNTKRKWVENTYEDEEGYIVTKKELVVDGTVENDEDNNKENPQIVERNVKTERNGKKTSPKENVAEKKGKKGQITKPTNQPTLMNFFTKK